MINKFIISVSSYIQLQGNEVLRLDNIHQEFASYQMVGFEDRPVTIQDYRPSGLQALNSLLEDGRSRDFRAKFNQPSNVLLFTGNQGEVLIQLMETQEIDPLYVLWIMASDQETIPLGRAGLFRDVRNYADNRKAFVSLHKQTGLGRHTPVDRCRASDPILQAQILEMDALVGQPPD